MTAEQTPDLRVGMVGYAFMGAAHSQAWRTAPRFFDLPMNPVMRAICGRDAVRTHDAARRLGWETTETDWHRVVARDDIDLVDVCTPGDTHAAIAIAALEAGKHVLCEKPLANSVEEAEAMVEAAERAEAHGVRAMVGFTYRRVPAIALARQIVASGRIGEVRQVRAQYLQDWLADPATPMSWRLRKDQAGSGALGDIGAHIVDLTQYITGHRISSVTGAMKTFVAERPVEGAAPSMTESVTVDDMAAFLAHFDSGAIGVFEATRFATGRKNAIRIEINGTSGSIAFDFEDMNVLHIHDESVEPSMRGYRRVLATEPDHPYMAAWWPPGHGLGYEHGFTHQVVDFVGAIAKGDQPSPTFADGLQVQQVLTAVETSSTSGRWVDVSG